MGRNLYKNMLKAFPALLLTTTFGLIVAGACVSCKKTEDKLPKVKETFHADNDIAMTIRSLVDAIKVGEQIDSIDYDFNGVLTDGQGSPLYTNLQGSPGEWTVDVLGMEDVTIKNNDLGDLLPGDLESYLLGSLSLGPQNRVYLTTEDASSNPDIEVNIYDFGGGYIRFENRIFTAPNGIQGTFFTIIVSKALPKGVGTQIAV